MNKAANKPGHSLTDLLLEPHPCPLLVSIYLAQLCSLILSGYHRQLALRKSDKMVPPLTLQLQAFRAVRRPLRLPDRHPIAPAAFQETTQVQSWAVDPFAMCFGIDHLSLHFRCESISLLQAMSSRQSFLPNSRFSVDTIAQVPPPQLFASTASVSSAL